jgi:hypothetical protein
LFPFVSWRATGADGRACGVGKRRTLLFPFESARCGCWRVAGAGPARWSLEREWSRPASERRSLPDPDGFAEPGLREPEFAGALEPLVEGC